MLSMKLNRSLMISMLEFQDTLVANATKSTEQYFSYCNITFYMLDICTNVILVDSIKAF